ncbi:STM4015 family protein [Oceanobacter mangrovi]|uniref:STM4015 family protein n=1 Tax=Oceanobacter mangrovi TaxID=2862510 RepID=UPI001C8EC1B0|nr:STM4015 family protein [Oceanobacter mangrovi]
MSQGKHLFAGKPVIDWAINQPLPDPRSHGIRLSVNEYNDDDPSFQDYFKAFLQQPGIDQIDTLLLGNWGEAFETGIDDALQQLVEASDRLSAVKHLALAEMDSEECEVSWINLGNFGSLYNAYPQLQTLQIKGSVGLQLGELNLPELRSLTLINGGLSHEVLAEISRANCPELQHLELWLGEENYGCDIANEHLQALVKQLPRFPQLSYLALCNYEAADELAKLLPSLELPATLTTLDLSKGTLSDEGGAALLTMAERLGQLQTLDLHHHYLCDDMMQQLQQLPCQVDVSEQQETDYYDDGDVYRYIFLAE